MTEGDVPGSSLRLGAYVMLGDPAFLEESVSSYYSLVDRIVASYDVDSIGWTGAPLKVEECLSRLRSLDVEGKVEELPGNFHSGNRDPMEADTYQRNVALGAVGVDVDWVLQLDTDEVLGSPRRLLQSLIRAHGAGCSALDYPARWLYCQVRGRWYLERSGRLWQPSASYPGPVAVKPGTLLRHARQCDGRSWHVDFRRRNTDPMRSVSTRIDEVVDPRSGIWHFSWVRSEEALRAKGKSSGHADAFDWSKATDELLRRRKHPVPTVLGTPLRRRPSDVGAPTWLRLSVAPGTTVMSKSPVPAV